MMMIAGLMRFDARETARAASRRGHGAGEDFQRHPRNRPWSWIV